MGQVTGWKAAQLAGVSLWNFYKALGKKGVLIQYSEQDLEEDLKTWAGAKHQLPVVSNTSPLIWLSKTGKINLLKELFQEITIPEEVYTEAVERGLQEGFSDALIIKEAVEQGWIRISQLNKKETALCQKIIEA